MSQNLNIRSTRGTSEYNPLVGFTLQPAQVSAISMWFGIDYTAFVNDATAVISAFQVNGTGWSGSIDYTSSLPKALVSNSGSTNIFYTLTATGQSVYATTQHTATVNITGTSTWVSGNSAMGMSTPPYESITWTSTLPVCSFTYMFSTVNSSAPAVTGFTATAGDQHIDLAWTLAANTTAYVCRSLSGYPISGIEGNIYRGTGSSTIDVAVSYPDVTRYYSMWSRDADGDYSIVARATAVPRWHNWVTRTAHTRLYEQGQI